MLIRGARYFLFSIILVSCTLAENGDVEWFGSDVPANAPKTKTYDTTQPRRKTTTSAWEITPRTKNLDATISTTSSSELFPVTNITNKMTAMLKNFAKFTSSNPSFPEGNGDENFGHVLRLEVLTIATGNHFIVPPPEDEKIEETQRKSAAALTALWLDLFCTEDIDTILNNVSTETVVQYGSNKKSLTVDKMSEMLRTLFRKLNDTIEEDPFLSTMYTAEQIRHRIRFFHTSPQKKIYFPFSELIAPGQVDRKMVDEWVNNIDIRKYLIHRQFLTMRSKLSRDTENGDHLWVTSILKVAREECCIDRMQKIYNTALDEAAKNFVAADFSRETMRTFVSKLTKAIEANEALKKEWINQKSKIEEKSQNKNNRRERL